ncbi:DUF421 domain-containing protein [Variovorax sp. 350MFTsu5.1]|uniref:DUF421 domain-containing protein n=1 Tax=Variovorax sp. 350MFTsu5.1 TaxID=3158365 RepID=UPI003AAE5D0D
MSEVAELFAREFPVWHMVVRGTVVYWFLLLVFRFVLRRDIGSMGVADLLFVVLVADASSNAMQGEYKSIDDGFVLLATLVAWNFALDWLSFHFEPVARFLEPRPEVLIRNGRLNRRALRREMIRTDELLGKLREQGVADFSEVRVARLESDGTLSVFKKEKKQACDDSHQAPKPSKPPVQ